jgi:UDP:flavonoid glycosyltransferase YjiC (YdhE family)
LGHRLTRQAVWTTARSSGNNARREILGQRPAPWSWPAALAPGRLGPLLYGLSPAFLGKPHDWPPAIEVTGFWSLVEETAWTPPPELLRFIERGPAPVYLGFGSMSHRSPEATTRLVLSAIQQSGQRALLHTGWGGLDPGTVPDNVLMIGSVPHAWLFERVAAVVHHGGAGTTAAGVRAGVPSLIVPFHGDQPFWAARVAALGVGPRPIKRQRLTAPALAEAIKRAVSDEPMRRRAAELGALVRAEDGVGQAVAVIERALRA